MKRPPKLTVRQTMIWVIAASIPALAFLTLWQGFGFLINVLTAIAAGLFFEMICLTLRKKAYSPLSDGSAVLTAILFAAGVPGLAPFWVLIVGMFFAIVLGKQVYGGLGQNLFNPAMIAYAVVLIAFPAQMVVWPAWAVQGMTAATPLDHANASLLEHDLFPSLMLNALWLLGGLVLLFKGLIGWQIPAGLILGMLALALFFPDPLLQLGLGATLIGAFFIATDPVTAPGLPKARFLYGLLIGLLIMSLRKFSSYPDGLAFAVLLANACTPLFDQLSIRKSS